MAHDVPTLPNRTTPRHALHHHHPITTLPTLIGIWIFFHGPTLNFLTTRQINLKLLKPDCVGRKDGGTTINCLATSAAARRVSGGFLCGGRWGIEPYRKR